MERLGEAEAGSRSLTEAGANEGGFGFCSPRRTHSLGGIDPPRTVYRRELRYAGNRKLPAKPGVQLNNTRPGRIQQLPEESIIQASPKPGQVGVVQRVKHVRTNLYLGGLCNRHALANG